MRHTMMGFTINSDSGDNGAVEDELRAIILRCSG